MHVCRKMSKVKNDSIYFWYRLKQKERKKSNTMQVMIDIKNHKICKEAKERNMRV